MSDPIRLFVIGDSEDDCLLYRRALSANIDVRYVMEEAHEGDSACDRRGRPAVAGNRSLPDDIARFAPFERQTTLGGMSLPCRSAKLRPIERGRTPGRDTALHDQANYTRDSQNAAEHNYCF